MVGPRLGIAPMAGARLGYCAKWLAQGWVSRQMVATRLEDLAKWLARGMRIAPNGWHKADYRTKAGLGTMAANGLSARKQQSNGNRGIMPANWKNCGMAINGSHGPKEKNAAQQSTDRVLAKEKSRRSNWGIVLAKRKMQRGNWWIAPVKRKITVWQSIDRPGQKENHSAAIDGLRRSKEKLWCGNRQIAPAKRKHLRCVNQGIAPAKRKIAARQSGYRAYLFKNLHKAWGSCQMVVARLEGRAKWLARGLRIPPNGWREANIALDGGARLILRSMVAQG
jgi:hypothetical protein